VTTLNLQVGAGGDDGHTFYTPPSDNPGTPNGFTSDGTDLAVCNFAIVDGYSYTPYLRFTGVSGLSGQTIGSAIFKPYGFEADTGTPQTLIGADDQVSPAAPTTKEEHDAITRTTAKVTWDNCDLSTSAFVDSPDIKTVIQELADSFDPTVIQLMWDDDLKTDSDNRSRMHSYDGDTAKAAKLDIDHSAGGVTTRRYSLPVTGVG